jgi:hypothetical protein
LQRLHIFHGFSVMDSDFHRVDPDLLGYIDDNFSFDEEGEVAWYQPYNCYFPTKQTKLLKLWDKINLPHEKSKQEYGPTLRIIGFLVDPNLMRVSMDEEDRIKLIQHVVDFMATAPGGTRRTLHAFQQIAGWINWSFNVFPLLKPVLSNVYAKMSGKSDSYAKIYVSRAVIRDLEWFISHVRASDGVYLFQDIDWTVDQADVVYVDACLSGLGLFFQNVFKAQSLMTSLETQYSILRLLRSSLHLKQRLILHLFQLIYSFSVTTPTLSTFSTRCERSHLTMHSSNSLSRSFSSIASPSELLT